MKTNVWCNTCETAFSANHGEDGKCPRCRSEYSLVGVRGTVEKIGVKEIIIVHGLNARIAAIQARIEGMKADGGYGEGCFLAYGKDLDAIAEGILKIADGIADSEGCDHEMP